MQNSIVAAADSDVLENVLFSGDLWTQQLWQWIDSDSKRALRGVSKRMRSQVDGAITRVASPSAGASADDLASALLRWSAVRDLTLLNVSDAAALAPLSTATLPGLTSLTVRQVGVHGVLTHTPTGSSRSPACGTAPMWFHIDPPHDRAAALALQACQSCP
jgi:hypothetical protein